MKKIPYPHPALNIQEQVSLLRAKGLLITETDAVEHWLSHVSYFRLKNYSYSFKDYKNAGGNYFPDTSFKMVKDLYAFDRKLRMIVFHAVENIRISVKTHISNIMSEAHGPHWYLDSRHFFSGRGFNHQKFLKHIRDVLLNKPEPILRHYRKKYDPVYPPSWILMDAITFRTLSFMFRKLKPSAEKIKICHSFNLTNRQLISWLHSFTFIRNKCAHHVRLVYSRTLFPPSIPDKEHRRFLTEAKTVDNATLYAILSCLQYMLTICNRHSCSNKTLSPLPMNSLTLTSQSPALPPTGNRKNYGSPESARIYLNCRTQKLLMKKLVLLLPLFITLLAHTQTKNDTVQQVRDFAKWLDLDFTAPEADSMLGDLRDFTALYNAMHRTYPKNDLPFPFAFQPAPYGYKIPDKQAKVNWNIPSNVTLPANRNELAFYSIPQLASLIKNKKITSVELTKFFLDRLKKWGDTLECVITLTEELALQEAKQADDELKRGIYRGPLHGIPYGLKDLFAVKGYKTTWGSTPYKDQVVDENSFVYTQLKNAGAVLCAKLSLGALAFDNRWFGGFTRNPWNLQQGSSGSSAGSAAATVAGLLPFAIGTETLGSIVSPSARCGATGLRPTFGTVSRSGAMVLCWSLDKAGPICRSAEDAAIVYYYIKGTDGKDAGSVDHAFNYNDKTDLKKLRIAYAENFFKRLPKEAMEWKVIEQYKSLGVNVQPVVFADSALYPSNIIDIILSAESSAAFDELTRSNRDDLIERQDKNFWPNIFRGARFIPATEYINANRYRSALCKGMNEFMKNFDVLIVPTFAGRQLAITNLTGHPVVCMPMGFNQRGLPQSITLIGNLYDEATILAVAKAYQDVTDHNKKHPEKFKQ